MINLTPLIRPFFLRRVGAAQSWRGRADEVQQDCLARLIARGRRTAYGAAHGFDRIRSYDDFAAAVPVVSYEDIRPWIMRALAGERDVLWPGVTASFAQSSGTSDGKSKYIPITSDSFKINHYAGGRDVVAHYLGLYPDSRIFAGKSFILGGSFANEVKDLRPGVRVGDLSANLIDNINPLVNLLRVPDKKTALMADWTEKLPVLVEASLNQDITNISGVPSWFMTVIERVIERAGATTIHDVWPNLEVFFHGGISFEPYREQYRRLTDPSRMRYLETYNASEGFFAVQSSLDSRAMLLLLDIGVFYEFMPLDSVGSDRPELLPPWRVEQGETYALVITACNGLWRYAIGDTVRIESVDPLKITIAGRTKHFINAFGEELMVHNADAALSAACAATGASLLNYTAAPVFADGHKRGHHQWLIEWRDAPPSLDGFARELDMALQRVNSDYQAKRSGGIFLDPPEIVTARPGLFDSWLASTGKLGGQRKVPRLANDRRVIDSMLEFNNK